MDRDRDTHDWVGIQRLLATYADLVNRRAWAELGGVFRPDAALHLDLRAGDVRTLTGPAEIGAFIGDAVARFDFFEMVVLTAHVELRDRDDATGRVYIHEIRHDAADGRRSDAYGLYQDRYTRVDDRWWFAERRYASLARTGPGAPAADLAVFDLPATAAGLDPDA